MSCLLCRGPVRTCLTRERLPLMQNLVYADREDARRAPTAPLSLAVCERCGFAFNAAFDAGLMVYDERYNNDVPSPAFERYCRDIAAALVSHHRLDGGRVVDIGAGKGRFLELFVADHPAFQGLGIDPTCAPRSGPVTLVRDVLRPEHIARDAVLVTCRHTLEHIADPLAFVTMIRATLTRDVPVFFEVPDLAWTLEHGAFWDFCYEHCNYFTPASLATCLRLGGFEVEAIVPAFGGQYLWAHARPGTPGTIEEIAEIGLVAAVSAYAEAERARIANARATAEGAVIWGMATKGVLFALLVDAAFAGGVDINPAKIGAYAPVTGLAIHPPEWLVTSGATRAFVMNPNYTDEIAARCAELGLTLGLRTP